MEANQLNGAALAYIGDAVYEIKIREYVIINGLTNPNHLHHAAIKFVEAGGQAKVIQAWLHETNKLTQEEISIYKRGRNNKANTKAKNASIAEYRQATGFEALIGWLYLKGRQDRLEELLEDAIDIIEGDHENACG